MKSEIDKSQLNGETLQLNVNIIGRIPFYNIVNIIEEGDSFFGCPHIYCNFLQEMGPFSEICYEFHDFKTGNRIFFEKGQKALISEYAFINLKKQLNKS